MPLLTTTPWSGWTTFVTLSVCPLSFDGPFESLARTSTVVAESSSFTVSVSFTPVGASLTWVMVSARFAVSHRVR